MKAALQGGRPAPRAKATCRGCGDQDGREPVAAARKRSSSTTAAEMLGAELARPAPAHAEPPVGRSARRHGRGRQRRAPTRATTPMPTVNTSACPHWDIGARARASSIQSGRSRSAARCSRMYRGWGARLAPRHGPAQPRPQRRRLRGDPTADPRAHRHDDLHRPPPQVRGRGLPRRARRPLGHPHRRGSAHLAAPRRGARRGRPAAAATSPTRRASAARRGPPAATPAACSASTSSTRSSCWSSPPTPSRRSPARRTCSRAASRCCATSASPTASSTCAPPTSATRPPAPGTSRPTRRGATCGSRSRRSPGSPTTRPDGRPSATGPEPGKGTDASCHTVNGSAMGFARTVAAYLETHRQPDGTVAIVEALRPYLGGADVIPRPGRR